jgi:D-alanyl-D-alanine carboxypeptidase (penicillin-binding protein 5/6)
MKRIISWITRRNLLLLAVGLIALFALIGYVQLQRDPPGLRLRLAEPAQSNADTALDLQWPNQGSAAVAVYGAGVVDVSKNDRPQPIASLVKVMTAYVVLKDNPLRAGDQGPPIEIQASDVQLYRDQQANGESVVPVQAGTSISEHLLLQGLLIPSGNNLAYVLANWNSGSVEAFVQRMNEEAAGLGMTNTHYEDPSGVSAITYSTAGDQIKLAMAAMANPIFASIVLQKQTTLPTAGTLFNVNSLLADPTMVGIKTGWTEEAGACFLFATDWQVGERKVRLIGAVLGQDTLADAFTVTRRLINGTGPGLQVATVMSKDAPAASLSSRWGVSTEAFPKDDVSIILWPGRSYETTLEPLSLDEVEAGAEVGKAVVTSGDQRQEVTLTAKESVPAAGLRWRLTRW